MRYIGSKLKLINYIKSVVVKYCGDDLSDKVFCDLFAGTGIVGKSFAPYVKSVIANDVETYSYMASTSSLIGYNEEEVIKHLKIMNQIEPDYDCDFAQYYAEGGYGGRLFFTKENGAKIGAARNYVDRNVSLIDTQTYRALVLSIINGADDVANCTGVYGAFLKEFKPGALKPVVFKLPEMANDIDALSTQENFVYKEDANELIKKVKGNILYLDPPYNTRQYSSNYHILNYLALNYYPETKSVAGLGSHYKSKYSSKRDAAEQLDELIKNADFEWIFMSYNNEGIIPIEQIEEIMSKYGEYHLEEKEHQRYKADSKRRNLAGTDKTIEYIHVLHKTKEAPAEIVVSPMNYMGGKKKLIKKLLEYFPKDVNTFIDLFCGGATVGINCDAKSVYFNDNICQLMQLYNKFRETPIEIILNHIDGRIEEYGLSETNEEGYYKFRDFYNENPDNPLDVFVLAAYSFNNQIRFGSRGNFNIPFGKNRSSFNNKMRQNLIGFVKAIQSKNVIFTCGDFDKYPFNLLSSNDFVYCDPPYLVSVATYNSGWDEEKERKLLNRLSELNERGIRFALSNVLENKGQENTILKEWVEKNNFTVIHLDKTYSNCYYQRKEKDTKSDEVLIINYNLPMAENEVTLFSEIEEKSLSLQIEANKIMDKIELNNIYNCDCLEGLKLMEENSVDLVLTSPPYDELRKYGQDELAWNFDIFKPIAKELARVIKKGGVIVWNVGDAVVKGSETGSSFRQALYFMEECGLKLHDTMIYEKNSSSFPARIDSKRYTQIFEYMFVFTKGDIRKDIKLIADKRNKWAGWTNWGQHSQYDAEGNLVQTKNIKPIAEFSLRTNIWKYSVSFNDKTGHPAVFPEKMAEDHILSWTNEGDVVLDPFMGSGTTAKMAMMNKRNYIGFEMNPDYYAESLKRVGKYDGKFNEDISGTTVNGESLQVNVEDDKEEAGKTELWNKLINELNQYFNEQTLGILKQLKFTFASKSNDERVKKVLEEDKQEIPMPTIEDITEPEETFNPSVEEMEAYDEMCKGIDEHWGTVTGGEKKIKSLNLLTEERVREIVQEELDKRFPTDNIDTTPIDDWTEVNKKYEAPSTHAVVTEPRMGEEDIIPVIPMKTPMEAILESDFENYGFEAKRKRKRRSIEVGAQAYLMPEDCYVTILSKEYDESIQQWRYRVETSEGIVYHPISNDLVKKRVKMENPES